MRLTSDLIKGSLSYRNPLKEYELTLRGHKIPTIENLGAASDPECIDFTDNEITNLANFPFSPRLQTLLCARNRITTLEPSIGSRIPNLGTLVLSENNVAELADLNPLRGCLKLRHLTLVDNPVTSKEEYRYYVLWLCPQVRFLDYQKVKDTERVRAKELFGTVDEPTELAKSIGAVRSSRAGAVHASGTNGAQKRAKITVTDEEKLRFANLVKQAKSLAEVQKLEKMFSEGRLPPAVESGDAMDET